MSDDYLVGHLYALGRPRGAFRFVKVLATSDSTIFVRPFARPPDFRWWLEPTIPILSAEAQPADEEAGPGIRILEVSRDEFATWIPVHVVPEGRGTVEADALDRLLLERIPVISNELVDQLRRVEPSRDGKIEYRPCLLRLQDNSMIDRVYLVEAAGYIQHWGIWPEHDKHKKSISITDVRVIEESPSRIPARLANRMYEAGESAMGGCFFILVLNDGREIPCVTGNAVDFVELPEGVTSSMIIDLLPHEGREYISAISPRPKGTMQPASGADYWWCLYRVPAAES